MVTTTGLVRVSDRLWTFKRGQVTYQLTAYPLFIRVRYQYPGEGWQVGSYVPYRDHPLPTVRVMWEHIAGMTTWSQYQARLLDMAHAVSNKTNISPGVQTPDPTR